MERSEKVSEEKKYIRFIDSDYKTLFFLPDGGRIRITHRDGKQFDRICRFIDVCHTKIGYEHFHICEFAERMEQNGATYEPLDYIQEPEFYRKVLMTRVAGIELPPGAKPPAYYVIDETADYGFAFAPKGAQKGQRYCIFEKRPDEYDRNSYKIGEVLRWSGSLREIRLQDYGFNVAKIKAAAQRPKTRDQPER